MVPDGNERVQSAGLDSMGRAAEGDELRRLVDITIELLCVASIDGRFLWLNPAWESALGFACEELLAKPCLEFVHPDDVAATQEAFRQLSNGQNVTDFVNRYRRKDGTYRALEWRSVAEGSRIYAAARDVTAHRRADEALQRMAAIVEHSEDAIYSKDRDFLITSWNNGAERLYGYSADEAIGQHISLIVPDDRLDELRGITERCLRGEHVERIETVRRRKDGVLVDISLVVSPIRDPAGNVLGSAVIARDITERRIALAALRYERDRAQLYLDLAEVMMIVLDTRGDVVMINRKGCQVVGFEEAELLGRNWFEICVPREHRGMAMEAFQNAMARQDGEIWTNENLVVSKAGVERLIEWHSTTFKDEAGRVSGTLSCGEDVTDNRAAAAERERLITQLQVALAQVKTLSGMLPICAHCKKVRDDQGYWHGVELYLAKHTDATFSHGVCPDCLKEFYPWMGRDNEGDDAPSAASRM